MFKRISAIDLPVGQRALWAKVCLGISIIAICVWLIVYFVDYQSYSNPYNWGAYDSVKFSEHGNYYSTSILSLHSQDDVRPFMEVDTGDMVDVFMSYGNSSHDEQQEACMLVQLPSSLNYVQGSAMFQPAGSSEWRSFSEDSDVDAFFTQGVHLGACPPGQQIGFRFTVKLNTSYIMKNADTFSPMNCFAYQYGDTEATTHSTAMLCHRTNNRLGAFLESLKGDGFGYYITKTILTSMALLGVVCLSVIGYILMSKEIKYRKENKK